MVLFKAAFASLLAMTYISMVSAIAAYQSIRQCTASDCGVDDCPNTFWTDLPGDSDGLGILDYPACTIYSGGLDGFSKDENGRSIVWHDVSEPDEGCAYILLSPANVDEPGCGTPVGQFRNAVCVRSVLANTYMWQRCCGQGCDDAGVSRRGVRGSNWLGSHSPRRLSPLEGSLTTFKLHNGDGEPIKVHSSRPAILKDDKRDLARRDCTGFTEERRYTTSGKTVTFGGTIEGPGEFELTSTTSVSHTTSVSATVGDPFGIVSTTVGFETTEENSKSLSYKLTLEEGQLGTASWTPILDCIEGTFTGCGDEGDQHGNVCTPSIAGDGTPNGIYRTILQS
ncbi:hypothetical protein OC846_006072 [Tilletia horrida]|uniref:Uncharacterized protein n=1 Tax=Tilletia horrida TaxID=155126 RepID=A0AAN6GJJ0_9BASI|nr:hypothetical protein OC846_006072 [Tilletia horrida]KAK0560569.1 hypothetical protein OC861_006224 [Tilletia horrida]